MKKTRKFVSIFAILFALVFALSVCFFAACGNKDDDEKDNDTTTEQDGDTSGDGNENPEPEPDPEPVPEPDPDPEPEATTVTTAEELEATLLEDGDIELGASITGTFTVSADTTLDLAGYSISDAAEKDGAVITVASTGSLTVKDSSEAKTGSIACTYTTGSSTDNAAAILTTGTLVLDGGTVTSTSTGINAQGGDVTINGATVDTTSGWWAIFENTGALADSNATAADVTVTINEGAVVKGNTKTIYLAGDSDGYSSVYNSTTVSKLVVNGGTITGTGESAISTRGLTAKECAVVEINGGTITGSATQKGPAVYIPNGILTITDGTISGSTAVEVRGGTTKISGGTFTSTYTGTPSASYTTSGATSIGYALTVYPYTSTNRDSDTNFSNDVEVTVSGGTFEGALYKNITRTEDSFTITGGTFLEDVEIYLDTTQYHTEPQSSGMYKVASGVAGQYVEGMITADGFMASREDITADTTLNSTYTLYEESGTKVEICGSSSAKFSRKNRKSTDGYTFKYAAQLATASTTVDSESNCLKITVTEECTVTLYVMSSNSSDARTLSLWTLSESTYVADSTTYDVPTDSNDNFTPLTITLSAAGTYLIGASGSANYYGLMFGSTAV